MTLRAHLGRLHEREGRGERRGRVRDAGVRRRRVCLAGELAGDESGQRETCFNLWPGPESGVLV